MDLSARATRNLALLLFFSSVILGVSLALSWRYFDRVAAADLPEPPPLAEALTANIQNVSPLLVQYQLDVPGRGEIFPSLNSSSATDYWPLAVLTIINTSDRPSIQVVNAEVVGWSSPSTQTLMLAPHETRKVRLNPELLPPAYDNSEIRRATLKVQATNPWAEAGFSKSLPVYLHSAYDLYWGSKFSNAQFVARWVTPHDPAVLALVANAKRFTARGRMAGYDLNRHDPTLTQTEVRQQARALFEAFRNSGITYVSSIFTFGNFTDAAQRIRPPSETLTLRNANCIDASVAYASAVENLGMAPVIVIVPGHAFAGIRLGPQSPQILYLDLTVLPRGNFEAALARAQHWMHETTPDKILTVDVAAARALGIYPLPTMQAPAFHAQTAANMGRTAREAEMGQRVQP